MNPVAGRRNCAMLRLLFALILFISASLRGAEINVYAAASLTDALKEIGAAYQAQSNDSLFFNFAASSTLARQIEEGAPADIFLSADDAQMDRLQKSGRIDETTRRELLSNSLVIIAAADRALVVGSPAELARRVDRIALADPKLVPAGVYARGYLEKAGVWKELEPKVVPVENVRAVTAAVASGNVDAGFVYKTDAGVSKKAKIIFEIPAADAPPVNYPVALVMQSVPKPDADTFLHYLGSEPAAQVFEKFGFVVKR